MQWLEDTAASYLLHYLNKPARPWRDWEELRETIENLFIIDTGGIDQLTGTSVSWCTCNKNKEHKKQKQEACVHCLGVRLLVNGHLGHFELDELMPFAPKSRGNPVWKS